MKKLMIVLAIVVPTLVAGAAAAYFVFGKGPNQADQLASEQSRDEARDPIYWSLDPKFTITYNTSGGLRYLQVSMEVMAYRQEAIDGLKANMPAVRNNVIMLLSDQEFNQLASTEGKEALRQAVLGTIQGAIRSDAELAQVFFTSFILQ